MKKTVVVIGGGIAGAESAYLLAQMGCEVVLIEKTNRIGGHVLDWYKLFPASEPAANITDDLENRLKNSHVTVMKNSVVTEVTRNKDVFYVQTSTRYSFVVNAVVIATGFNLFDARRKEEYGYKVYDNVITSAELETKFVRESKFLTTNKTVPERIAMVHCVGSRDAKMGNCHCSKVCCVTAVKQAISLRQKLPNTEIFCFYMDLRMFGRSFEELYREAQEVYNIQFIRGRVSEVSENNEHRLVLKSEDTLSGRPLRMTTDMLVLMVGMESNEGTRNMAKLFDVELGGDGFIKSQSTTALRNICAGDGDGVFMAGTCGGPMSINETLENARSAAIQVNQYLQDGTTERKKIRIFNNRNKNN